MDTSQKRKTIDRLLKALTCDMHLAIDKMPDDWGETEITWLLVRRAGTLRLHGDTLQRMAFQHSVRTRGL